MPYSSCSASFCKNNRYNASKRGIQITFHVFPPPTDENQKKWIQFSQRGEGWIPNRDNVLCSVHFKEEDYQMAKSPLLKNSRKFRSLLASAVPTLRHGSPNTSAEIVKANKGPSEELHTKDKPTKMNDHSYIEIHSDSNSRNESLDPEPYVYQLESFPDVCVYCLKAVWDDCSFTPIDSYHNALECTIHQKMDELSSYPMVQMEYDEDSVLLPDKICLTCLDELVSHHQYQQEKECIRKFGVSIALLHKGNSSALKDLYKDHGEYLMNILNKLNIYTGLESEVSLQKMMNEILSYPRPKWCSVNPPRDSSVSEFSEENEAEVLTEPMSSRRKRSGNNTAFGDRKSHPQKVRVTETSKKRGKRVEKCDYLHVDDTQETPNDKNESDAQGNGDQSEKCKLTTHFNWENPVHLTEGDETMVDGHRKEARNVGEGVCPICKQRFPDFQAKEKHVRENHTSFECQICSMKFRFYDVYNKHMESHALARALLNSHANPKKDVPETDPIWRCAVCGLAFPREELLQRHKLLHKSKGNYVCGTCLGVYTNEFHFKKHSCRNAESSSS